ncbi:hypothetical protein [Bordetella genomosp. 5]|uniref:hypothetical protein n=1 Tax=Bordetella genomosp. 5 TaxID=1395608 RepID=UPI00114090BA|nr:hypothetical protein [Bordetella genomosp. 5]
MRPLLILLIVVTVVLALSQWFGSNAIGERAQGGYDGTSTLAPGQHAEAQRDARDAPGNAERATQQLKQGAQGN